MTTLADGQRAYRGLTFGDDTDYIIRREEGLHDPPDIRVGDVPLPRGHGNIPGSHYSGPRDVTFDMLVALPDLAAKLQALREIFKVADAPLQLEFKDPDVGQRYVWARPIVTSAPRQFPTVFYLTVALTCADPRIYGMDERQALVPLYIAGGGSLDFAVEYAKEWTGDTVLEAVATNGGDDDAYPVVQFYGPTVGTCTSVRLRNLTNGDDLHVVPPAGSLLTAGQILTADMHALVTANGDLPVHIAGASRYGYWQLPRSPFRLSPGDNTLRFEITGTSTDCRCVLTWHDTYLS